MLIKGTITRAYFGEGLSGPNGRFNGRNVIHVRPADPSILRDLDGDHQTATGEIRVAGPAGELPEIGGEVEFEVDETRKTLEAKKPRASSRSRQQTGSEGGGEGGEPT